jgi:hypothetical protein
MSQSSSKKIQPKSESGNTKQIPPARKWLFTFNNYIPMDIIDISSKCKELKSKYIFEKEVGEEGTPHLQGFIIFEDKVRPKSLFSTKIHWDKKSPKSTDDDCIKYCSKVARTTDNPSILFSNFYTIPLPLKILDTCKLRIWQCELIKMIKHEPDDRSIWWIWSQAGNTGKSTFCRYLAIKYNALIISGSNKDMKCVITEHHTLTGSWPRLIVIDIPRVFDVDYFSYSGLEEIKNGLFCSSKFKGSMALFNPPHIMVFSNEQPKKSNMSLDRWKICNIDVANNDIKMKKKEEFSYAEKCTKAKNEGGFLDSED